MSNVAGISNKNNTGMMIGLTEVIGESICAPNTKKPKQIININALSMNINELIKDERKLKFALERLSGSTSQLTRPNTGKRRPIPRNRKRYPADVDGEVMRNVAKYAIKTSTA